MKFKPFYLGLLFVLFEQTAHAELKEYTFDIKFEEVNLTGTATKAMTINGQIPAPLIEATIGDTLRVTYNNLMDVQTSIHWHGVLLPYDQDGVPGLNTVPIEPGGTFSFEFPVIHEGTYWYHSHSGLQEQGGLFGPLVFHSKKKKAIKEKVIMLSDWNDLNPDQVYRNLKKDGDYYALKKGSTQSWAGVFSNGLSAFKIRMYSSMIRMGPMDKSDVGYDKFLINGKSHSMFTGVKPGEKIYLRIINAGAASYFDVEFAGGDMTVVSSDGVDVEPFKVKRLRMAIAETYDVVVTMPKGLGSYELRATSFDGTGYASLMLSGGVGMMHHVKDSIVNNPYIEDHSKHKMVSKDMSKHMVDTSSSNMDMSAMDHSDHEMDMESSMKTNDMKSKMVKAVHMTDYSLLKSKTKIHYKDKPDRIVNLDLTGDMEKYVWSFNGKLLSEADEIKVKKGEVVRFVFRNRTMMNHPLHLHGHFFRVLNGQGDYSPLKHTVNVPPMEKVEIEFLASEEKDWIFHCHILYHMKAGMGRVVRYEGTMPNKYKPVRIGDDMFVGAGELSVLNNMALFEGHVRNPRWSFNVEGEHNYEDTVEEESYEFMVTFERFLTKYLGVYGGMMYTKEHGEKDEKGIVGFNYVLPFLIEASVYGTEDELIRAVFENKIALTKRLWLGGEYETAFYDGNDSLERIKDEDDDGDYEAKGFLEYIINEEVSLKALYDNNEYGGVGISIRF